MDTHICLLYPVVYQCLRRVINVNAVTDMLSVLSYHDQVWRMTDVYMLGFMVVPLNGAPLNFK